MAPNDRKFTVLVVTEDANLTTGATYGFSTGVDVLTARDAREALAVMERQRPSVVAVDIQTGSAGGFALAKEMSQRPQYAGIPMLMLLEREEDAWLARQAGATAYRVKPLGTDELVRVTRCLLTHSG